MHQEFEGVDLEDVKQKYDASLEGCIDLLEETLGEIKSGRASPNIFNDLEVKAYGEMYPF